MPDGGGLEKEEYIDRLRRFVRDREELNRLLDFEKESEDKDLKIALESALDEINGFPPIIKHWSFDEFPYPSLLLRGAAIWLLESAGIMKSRNRLQYQDGGTSVNVNDKAGEYQSWIQNFTQKYFQRLKQFKVQKNMDRAWGGFQSDYHRDRGQY